MSVVTRDRKINGEKYAFAGRKAGLTGMRHDVHESLKEKFPDQIEYECFGVGGVQYILHQESLIKKQGVLDLLIASKGTGDPSKELSRAIDNQTVQTAINTCNEIANQSNIRTGIRKT